MPNHPGQSQVFPVVTYPAQIGEMRHAPDLTTVNHKLADYVCSSIVQWNTRIHNKTEILGQIVCYKQEFVISEQFPMRYCSTWLRSLLCYIKKFVIGEFIRVFHCIYGSSY